MYANLHCSQNKSHTDNINDTGTWPQLVQLTVFIIV